MKIKIAAVLAATVCILIIAGQAFFGKLAEKNEVDNTVTETSVVSQTLSSVYLLKEYDGNLAVFENGSSEPAEVFSVAVSSFPEADRTLLETGIVVHSKAELQRLIEDYTG